MTLQTVTVRLPEDAYRRLQAMATTTRQPLESVVSQAIQGNLPPTVDDLPPELAEEFAAWHTLNDTALWRIAQEPLPAQQWRRHQALLRRQTRQTLSAAEQTELARLREDTDRFVLRRSYALALLKWRGHAVTPPAP